jgi:hypothetical protein
LAEPAGGIANPTAGRTEVKMAALAGLDRDRLWEAAMLCFQRLQARLADLAIDIEDKDARTGTGGDAEVGLRPFLQPRPDPFPVGGGVVNTVRRARVFARMGAGFTARA